MQTPGSSMDDLFTEEELELARLETNIHEEREWQDRKFWGSVLDTKQGRYVINCILEEMTHVYAVSFDPSSTHVTAFREGERNVGNGIITRAFANRQELFSLMRTEHEDRLNNEKERRGEND